MTKFTFILTVNGKVVTKEEARKAIQARINKLAEERAKSA